MQKKHYIGHGITFTNNITLITVTAHPVVVVALLLYCSSYYNTTVVVAAAAAAVGRALARLFAAAVCIKKNQNTPRPSEHPPVMGGKCQNGV